MKKSELRKRLIQEMEKYSIWPFEKWQRSTESFCEQYGEVSDKSDYQVTVDILEKEDDYILVSISVDDGRGGWFGIITPVGGTLKVYRDGRIEKFI